MTGRFLLAMVLTLGFVARVTEVRHFVTASDISHHPVVTFENIGPSGGYAAAIVFHPTDPNVVYAGMDDSGGLYVSQDGGTTWQNISLGVQNWSAWDLVVNHSDPNVITVVDPYGHGVRQSVDGGVTWRTRNTGLARQKPDRRVFAIVAHPLDPSVLYIGTADGVRLSFDSAQSWHRSSTGLPADVPVHRLAIEPSMGSALYAGLWGGEIYRSTDGGATWSRVHDLLPDVDEGEVWDLVVSAADPRRVIATALDKVFMSVDGGETWSELAAGRFDDLGGMPTGVTADFDPSDSNVIYLASFRINGRNRRLRSSDGGRTFTDITRGLTRETAFRLRVSPHDSRHIVLGLAGDGIEVSRNGGGSWSRHTGAPTIGTGPGGFAQAPSNPARLYLHGSPMMARTLTGGTTWVRSPAPVSLSWRLAVHPTDANVVLMAPLFLLSTDLYRSTDGAKTWKLVGDLGLGVTSILFDSRNADVVYATGFSLQGGASGVYKSIDGADTFQRLTPESWFDAVAPLEVIEHPASPGALMVATSAGLFVSDPSQSEFGLSALSGRSLQSVAASADGLWVAGAAGAAYVSSDAGVTWRTIRLPDAVVGVVLIDPDRPGRVLLGVNAVDPDFTNRSRPGLYLSDNYGRSFVEVSRGLRPADQVYRLAKDLSASDSYLMSLYSGAGGLYRVHIP